MNASYFDEPDLEFGNNGRQIDVRFGLTHFGPLDAGTTGPQGIRVGVVGDNYTNDLFHAFVDTARKGIEAKKSTLPTLYPPFKGFGENGAFCDFLTGANWARAISQGDLDRLAQTEPVSLMIERAADRYVEDIRDLATKSVDVVVCIISPLLLKKIDLQQGERQGPRSRKLKGAPAEKRVYFHDLLKARSMSIGRPIQVSRPGTLGGDVQRYRMDGTANKDIQDDATLAWNFFTALYYKAGGVPWRLVRDSSALDTCYVGISFYGARDGETLQTSVAHVFNERGEGIVVRGGPAKISKDDRTPHLDKDDAAKLLKRSLAIYHREHKNFPARLVVHKTSYFTPDEMAGFKEIAEEERIDSIDLVSIRKSMSRFFRQGSYPPLRGTCIDLDGRESLLYTNGSVDFYRCYPGLFVPRPLSLTWDSIQQAPRVLCREVLALSKMNWNTTVFANSDPITLGAAKVVGDIMRHIGENDPAQESYAYYM
jgi:hypothetical protein